jgi:hypothetical protein
MKMKTTTRDDPRTKPIVMTRISRDRAKALLDGHDNYRTPHPPRWLKMLAQEIDAGRWRPDDSPIRVDTGGTLRDGQNRLRAFLLSTAVELPVFVQTVTPGWWGDEGRPRSAGDFLRSKGSRDTTNAVVAIARILACAEDDTAERIATGYWSNEDIVSVATEWDDEIRWSISACGTKWASNPAPFSFGGAGIQAGFAWSRRYYPDAAESLLLRCRNDASGPKGDPAQALRRAAFTLGSQSGHGSTRAKRFLAVIRAITSEVHGQRRDIIRIAPDGVTLGDEWRSIFVAARTHARR